MWAGCILSLYGADIDGLRPVVLLLFDCIAPWLVGGPHNPMLSQHRLVLIDGREDTPLGGHGLWLLGLKVLGTLFSFRLWRG